MAACVWGARQGCRFGWGRAGCGQSTRGGVGPVQGPGPRGHEPFGTPCLGDVAVAQQLHAQELGVPVDVLLRDRFAGGGRGCRAAAGRGPAARARGRAAWAARLARARAWGGRGPVRCRRPVGGCRGRGALAAAAADVRAQDAQGRRAARLHVANAVHRMQHAALVLLQPVRRGGRHGADGGAPAGAWRARCVRRA
jgi:hypothetical protein